jgi:hypothetical protein
MVLFNGDVLANHQLISTNTTAKVLKELFKTGLQVVAGKRRRLPPFDHMMQDKKWI